MRGRVAGPGVAAEQMFTRPWRDYVLLVGLAFIFGSNFMMTRITVTVLPPMFVVSFRLLLATLALALIWRLSGVGLPRKAVWVAVAGSAFFGHTLPFSLLAWGQQEVDAGIAAILMATMPLFTLGLAQIFTQDERPNRYTVAGFALALAGIVVLMGPAKLVSLAGNSVQQYAIALAAISYGVNSIITKALVDEPWQSTVMLFLGVAFVLSLPLLLMSDLSSLRAEVHVWTAAVYTALGPTATGAILVVGLIKRAGASFTSQINFLVPVIGAGLAIAFLGERLPPNAALALAIILAGIAIARRRPKSKLTVETL